MIFIFNVKHVCSFIQSLNDFFVVGVILLLCRVTPVHARTCSKIGLDELGREEAALKENLEPPEPVFAFLMHKNS
ncbi:MAG: hypothetical protein FJY10_09580 [Bacteroidetes bacterium]|nr:hypothetical protein [Bacteroidota bacterium]